jgi:hypothetical protein
LCVPDEVLLSTNSAGHFGRSSYLDLNIVVAFHFVDKGGDGPTSQEKENNKSVVSIRDIPAVNNAGKIK